MYQAPGRQDVVGPLSSWPVLHTLAKPHLALGKPSLQGLPTQPCLPSTQPGARPTLSLAVQVDEGPVIQGEQGEEGEDGGEDVLKALGVGLVEQCPEHHREEYWWFRATPGAGAPPHPTSPLPRRSPALAKDTEAGEHEDEDGGDGRQRPGKVPGHYVEAGQEAVGRGGEGG